MASLFSIETLGSSIILWLLWYYCKLVISVVYTYAVGPAINKVDFKSKGKWALITGCTDGIGKEYARQLAAQGCDVVLVSRSMDKLKATAEEIEKEYKVETKVIQVDFTGDDDIIYEKIEKDIFGLEIGTLVNNVGISYNYPEYFLDVPEWDGLVSSLIKANVVPVTRLSKMLMPAMVTRGKGVVINIGSASSVIPSPMLTVYAATKAYVEKLSEGLEMEYGKQGIIVQCVMPGFVCSNMSGIKKSSTFSPTAKNFVKSAIGLVGTTSHTTGYLPHAFFVYSVNSIRNMCHKFSVWLITRSMENSRSKVLKKYKKN